ncbi:2-aminoethanethiol dioxygenase [Toxorhynchites rutilus septentrionalis]|uniref:2-aminoethanethiol dioxygenase n=1 Tax=Toxorhynchites rutilus septentrionalis TaxID=329112 RepID=UPI0024788C97|nr:2-aminoethanethiol dioxygenase [Toxorhynchites rutilus septentrionalis]
MTTLFARVFRQAKVTFEQTSAERLLSNLQNLRVLVEQLTLADLNLDTTIASRETFQQSTKAPCTFIDIYENAYFTMSVFILRENYTMPLHDHPCMHGLLRVVSGKVKIQSYTEIDRREETRAGDLLRHVLVNVEQEKVFSAEKGESAMLSPSERNYHEITAIGGPAAFFDILSPPYNVDIPIYGKRSCSFYRKLLLPGDGAANDGRKRMVLEKIPTPDHYYCDTEHYETPEFMFASAASK